MVEVMGRALPLLPDPSIRYPTRSRPVKAGRPPTKLTRAVRSSQEAALIIRTPTLSRVANLGYI